MSNLTRESIKYIALFFEVEEHVVERWERKKRQNKPIGEFLDFKTPIHEAMAEEIMREFVSNVPSEDDGFGVGGRKGRKVTLYKNDD